MTSFCHFTQDRPIEDICKKYSKGCEHCKTNIQYEEEVQFRYKNDFYCADCLADRLGIEKREYTAYQYYDIHGNFLGDSDRNTLSDILLDCSFVEYIRED